MSDTPKIDKKDDYILVTLTDRIITRDRALDILSTISKQSNALNCDRVLLDERSVEHRDVNSTDILKLSIEMAKQDLHKIYIAFWCKKELIDEDSNMLQLFTQTDEYVIHHFSEQEQAINWLSSKNRDEQ